MTQYCIDPQECSRLYQLGFGVTTIARQLKCSVSSVIFHLNKMGIQRRQPKRIEWPVEQMRQWYETDRLTVEEIGIRLGVSAKVANKACKRFGFQMRRRGPKSGPEHKGWKGGIHADKSGYVLVHFPNHPSSNSSGYVRQHRLIAEKILGRPLLATEVVHHIDDDPANNSPENLMVFETNGQHLAATLAGKCPNWSPEGKRRIQASARKRKRSAIHPPKEADVLSSQ